MIQIGKFNTLTVTRVFKGGCYLAEQEAAGGEIYLPKAETPKNIRPGDTITVFIYNESKNKLGATTQTPKAEVGDFASLTVVTVTIFGAFLEWGISKDLFVPKKYWRSPLREGEKTVVYLTLDYEKKGVIGTCLLSSHFHTDTENVEPNQKVDLIVWDITDLGAQVVIDNRYSGLLYRSEIFEPIEIGDEKEGYIKKIREDGLVDVSLQPQGFRPSTEMARETVLHALRESDGFLPLHDKSRPEEIQRRLNISKKLFKKTIGILYKEGVITIGDSGITLVASPPKKS